LSPEKTPTDAKLQSFDYRGQPVPQSNLRRSDFAQEDVLQQRELWTRGVGRDTDGWHTTVTEDNLSFSKAALF